MSEQPQRPTSDDDRAGWKAYWTAQGMPWRTEPEIDEERQRYLAERRAVKPDIEKGIYPFRDEHGSIKLSRADLEWMLANLESGGILGPVDWSDEKQRERDGLDLRGADLRSAYLARLPLSRLMGTREHKPWNEDAAATLVKGLAVLHLEGANLYLAHLEGACLGFAHLENVFLSDAVLTDADLSFAHLELAYLAFTDTSGLCLEHAHLEFATLGFAQMERASFSNAHLEGASLVSANLKGAYLSEAHMQGARLIGTHLEGADLRVADLGAKQLSAEMVKRLRQLAPDYEDVSESLRPATLEEAYLDEATNLIDATLSDTRRVGVSLADVRWNGFNLGTIDWSLIDVLGDEYTVVHDKTSRYDVDRKSLDWRVRAYPSAVRAYRQLAVALQTRGMTGEAGRFFYRSHMLERKLLWRQARSGQIELRHIGLRWRVRTFGAYITSLFLNAVSGYGYRPLRSLVTYTLVVGGFALAYYFLGPTAHVHFEPLGAVVFSVTSFHGRGFSPGENAGLTNPVTVIAAAEAVIGLLIEIVFIATFTQRFFAH